MFVCLHGCRCQGLDQGLVPAWIKSRWRPWQGRKIPVPTFSCSIQPSLQYLQWQHGMCNRASLDLYFNAPLCIRKNNNNKKGNKNVFPIHVHEVVRHVRGTRQLWPSITWRDYKTKNDPFALMKSLCCRFQRYVADKHKCPNLAWTLHIGCCYVLIGLFAAVMLIVFSKSIFVSFGISHSCSVQLVHFTFFFF